MNSDLISFKLGAILRRVQRNYNTIFLPHGVTVPQSYLLFSLMDNDGQSGKQLAEHLSLDSSAITGLLDRMTKENLIERRADPEDRRAQRVFLTEKGKEVSQTVHPLAKQFDNNIKSQLTEEEHKTLIKVLHVLEKEAMREFYQDTN